MIHYTPLRYPGGKRRLAALVIQLLEENGLRDIDYIEPFAGGAGVALGLLYQDYASTIHLNDLDRGVFAFWHTMLHEPEWLCKRVNNVKLTMNTWKRQRKIFERRDTADLDELGFAVLFLNRTNRSGIVGGGVIGGQQQNGKWGIEARFGRPGLVDRIKKAARYRDRICLYRQDAKHFTTELARDLPRSSFFFFDPPYIERSKQLYMNRYAVEDHAELAGMVQRLRFPWIVTYDLAALRHRLYWSARRIVYSLKYTAHQKHEGQEVMYFSDRLELPKATKLVGSRMQLVRHKCQLQTA